jgi:2TM domain
MTVSQLNTQNEFNSNYGFRQRSKEVSAFFLHFSCFLAINSIFIIMDYSNDLMIQWSQWIIFLWLVAILAHFYICFLSTSFEQFVYQRIKK